MKLRISDIKKALATIRTAVETIATDADDLYDLLMANGFNPVAIAKLNDEQSNGKANLKWVPVNERMPDTDVLVMTYSTEYDYELQSWDGEYWQLEDEMEVMCKGSEVTKWYNFPLVDE